MSDLDRTFAALGDATRRAILRRLAAGEAPLATLAKPFDMSLTAVSKHVRVLSDAGLVMVEKRGRSRVCRIEAAPMRQAAEWLSDYQAFWEGEFDALARHLGEG